jgi:hypothetical protein
VVALGLTTALPWISDILLTDIFAGTAVLALHLLVFAPGTLRRGEPTALTLFVAFAAATHSATLAVLVAIVAAAWLARRFWRDLAPGLGRGIVAAMLGVVTLLTTNFALSGQFAWTPGGYGIVFARMMQDGIVTRYLDDHCPDRHLKLCPYRHRLPRTADEFLWSDGPFNELGRFAGLGDEMRTIVLESLVEYPGAQIEAALADTAEQLVKVENGEGVGTDIFHTYGIIERYMPSIVPAMRAARQQHGEVHFRAVNAIDVPIALLSMLLLPLVMLWARRGQSGGSAGARTAGDGGLDLGLLAATVTIAILVNAAVCGTLSNPHNRYGARIVWIATFAVALVPLRIMATRRLDAAATVEGARRTA